MLSSAFGTHACENAWLIDSGASFHMTPNRNQFSKYEIFDDGKVYLGHNSVLDIVGRGSIRVKFYDSRICYLLEFAYPWTSGEFFICQ